MLGECTLQKMLKSFSSQRLVHRLEDMGRLIYKRRAISDRTNHPTHPTVAPTRRRFDKRLWGKPLDELLQQHAQSHGVLKHFPLQQASRFVLKSA